eukprot:TRINITY_DN1489_c1_g1_i4.p1 TRINITY_DN1489_c1_g1~~TRINITY_DN1489_c1_g1_i4.p1  ORF type:complete len:3101 (-),score=589.73 TRINITY_DN1489_c1_g1_i4:7370-16672(-)
MEVDHDLLLAIALSQSLMEEEGDQAVGDAIAASVSSDSTPTAAAGEDSNTAATAESTTGATDASATTTTTTTTNPSSTAPTVTSAEPPKPEEPRKQSYWDVLGNCLQGDGSEGGLFTKPEDALLSPLCDFMTAQVERCRAATLHTTPSTLPAKDATPAKAESTEKDKGESDVGAPLHPEQILRLSSFLEALALVVMSSSWKQVSQHPQNVAYVQTVCETALEFCLDTLHHSRFQNTQEATKVRANALTIIEAILAPSDKRARLAVRRPEIKAMDKSLLPAIVYVAPSSATPSQDSSQKESQKMTDLLNQFLSGAPASLQHPVAVRSVQVRSHADLIRHFVQRFASLGGASILLSTCSSLLRSAEEDEGGGDYETLVSTISRVLNLFDTDTLQMGLQTEWFALSWGVDLFLQVLRAHKVEVLRQLPKTPSPTTAPVAAPSEGEASSDVVMPDAPTKPISSFVDRRLLGSLLQLVQTITRDPDVENQLHLALILHTIDITNLIKERLDIDKDASRFNVESIRKARLLDASSLSVLSLALEVLPLLAEPFELPTLPRTRYPATPEAFAFLGTPRTTYQSPQISVELDCLQPYQNSAAVEILLGARPGLLDTLFSLLYYAYTATLPDPHPTKAVTPTASPKSDPKGKGKEPAPSEAPQTPASPEPTPKEEPKSARNTLLQDIINRAAEMKGGSSLSSSTKTEPGKLAVSADAVSSSGFGIKSLFGDEDEEELSASQPTSLKDQTTVKKPASGVSESRNEAIGFVKKIMHALFATFFEEPAPIFTEYFNANISQHYVRIFLGVASQQATPEGEKTTDTELLARFSSFGHHLTTSGTALKFLVDQMRGTEGPWPLSLPRDWLDLLAWIFVKERASRMNDEDGISYAFWTGVLNSIDASIKSAGQAAGSSGSEALNVDFTLVLIFLFHSFSVSTKSMIFSRCLEILSQAAANPRMPPVALLLVTRLLQIVEYISFNFDNAPPDYVVELLNSNIFKRTATGTSKTIPSLAAQLSREFKEQPRGSFSDDVYYELRQQADIQKRLELPSSSAKSLLMNPSGSSYEVLYVNLCILLSATVDVPTSEIGTYNALLNYYYNICWRLLCALPPSAAFLESLKNPVSLATDTSASSQNNALVHFLYWLTRSVLEDVPDSLKPLTRISHNGFLEFCIALLEHLPEALWAPQNFRVDALVSAVGRLFQLMLRQTSAQLSLSSSSAGGSAPPAPPAPSAPKQPAVAKETAAKSKSEGETDSMEVDSTTTSSTTKPSSPASDAKSVLDSLRQSCHDFCIADASNAARLASAPVGLLQKYTALHVDLLLAQLHHPAGVPAGFIPLCLAAGISKANIRTTATALKYATEDVQQISGLGQPRTLTTAEKYGLSSAPSDFDATKLFNTVLSMPARPTPEDSTPLSIVTVQRALSVVVGVLKQVATNLFSKQSELAKPLLMRVAQVVLPLAVDPCFQFLPSIQEWLSPLTTGTTDKAEPTVASASASYQDMIDKYRLEKIEELLRLLAEIDSTNSTNIHAVALEAISHADKLAKANERRPLLHAYYCHSQAPSGDLSSWIRFLVSNNSPTINKAALAVLQQYVEIAKPEGDALSVYPTISDSLVAKLLELPDSTLTTFVTEKLLAYETTVSEEPSTTKETATPAKDSTKDKGKEKVEAMEVSKPTKKNATEEGIRIQAQQLISVLCDRSPELSKRVFHCILNTLPETFFITGVEFTQYITLLVRLASGDKNTLLGELVAALTRLTSQPDFATNLGDPQLKALSVLLPFLETVLTQCAGISPVVSSTATSTPMETESKSLVCTYVQTGDTYQQQHWYYCYTCSLTFSKGCCSACVRVCHKGHDVSYSRKSSFFCDCGAGAVSGRPCKCLVPSDPKEVVNTPVPPSSNVVPTEDAPRTPQPTTPPAAFMELAAYSSEESEEDSVDSDMSSEEEETPSRAPRKKSSGKKTDTPKPSEAPTATASSTTTTTAGSVLRLSAAQPVQVPSENRAALLKLVGEANLADALQKICACLHARITGSRDKGKDKEGSVSSGVDDLFSSDKNIVVKPDALSVKRTVKNGSFEIRDTTQETGTPESKIVKQLIAASMVVRSVLAVSTKGRIALVEGNQITLLGAAQLLQRRGNGGNAIVERSSLNNLATAELSFEPMSLAFNPAAPSFLAVAGVNDVTVITVTGDEITARLDVHVGLEGHGPQSFVVSAQWLPGSQVQLAVASNRFVKIFDLSKDSFAPVHCFTLIEDTVRGVAFVPGDTTPTLLVISSTGMLYSQELYEGGDGGPCILTNTVPIPAHLRADGSQGSGVHYSPSQRLVICSFDKGNAFAGRLDPTNSTLVAAFPLTSKQLEQSRDRPIPCHLWQDMPSCPGTLAAVTRKNLQPVAVTIQNSSIHITPLTYSGHRVEGIATIMYTDQEDTASLTSSSANTPVSPYSILVLYEDGCLQRWDMPPSPTVTTATPMSAPSAPVPSEQLRKSAKFSATPKASSDAVATSATSSNNSLAVDFFESTQNITSTIVIGGDILKCFPSDEAKRRLATNDEYLASPVKEKMTLTISNPESALVMVGLRILVGNASVEHIPTSLRIFDRTVTFKERVRRWYDVPFLPSECMQADQQFSLTVTAPHQAGKPPLIDSLEIYARPKRSFHWTEKLLSQHCESIASLTTTTQQQAHVASVSALVSSLHLLNACYLANVGGSIQTILQRKLGELLATEDSNNKATLAERLTGLLALPTLHTAHSSVRRLLHTLLPNPRRYHALKDRVRLTRVAESVSGAASGTTDTSANSTAQLLHDVTAVHKIAVNRPVNFSKFLAQHPTLPSDLLRHIRAQVVSANMAQSTSNGAQRKDSVKRAELMVTAGAQIVLAYAAHLLSRAPETKTAQSAATPALLLLDDLLTHASSSQLRANAAAGVAAALLGPLPPSSRETIIGHCKACSIPIVSSSSSHWTCSECDSTYTLCGACYGASHPPPLIDDTKPQTASSGDAMDTSKHEQWHRMTQAAPAEQNEESDDEGETDTAITASSAPTPMDTTSSTQPKEQEEGEDEESLLQMAIAMSMSGSQAAPTQSESSPATSASDKKRRSVNLSKERLAPVQFVGRASPVALRCASEPFDHGNSACP